MMRFVDLGKQLAVYESNPNYPRQFAFYNTVSDTFITANGGSAFDSWGDFLEQAAGELAPELINRLRSLCPQWVLDPIVPKFENGPESEALSR